MTRRLTLLPWMLLAACLDSGGITASAATRPPTVEIAPAEAPSSGGAEPEDAPRLSARPSRRPAAPREADVRSSCTLKGKQLWGKVQVVDAFPDLKVQVVDAFADLKV